MDNPFEHGQIKAILLEKLMGGSSQCFFLNSAIRNTKFLAEIPEMIQKTIVEMAGNNYARRQVKDSIVSEQQKQVALLIDTAVEAITRINSNEQNDKRCELIVVWSTQTLEQIFEATRERNLGIITKLFTVALKAWGKTKSSSDAQAFFEKIIEVITREKHWEEPFSKLWTILPEAVRQATDETTSVTLIDMAILYLNDEEKFAISSIGGVVRTLLIARAHSNSRKRADFCIVSTQIAGWEIDLLHTLDGASRVAFEAARVEAEKIARQDNEFVSLVAGLRHSHLIHSEYPRRNTTKLKVVFDQKTMELPSEKESHDCRLETRDHLKKWFQGEGNGSQTKIVIIQIITIPKHGENAGKEMVVTEETVVG